MCCGWNNPALICYQTLDIGLRKQRKILCDSDDFSLKKKKDYVYKLFFLILISRYVSPTIYAII